jgi:hypothetical protein
MSYCTLEEAFQTSMSDSVLPPMRQQSEEPGRGEKGRTKSKTKRRSTLPPQEPSVIEPDRPAHREKPAAELLGGTAPRNEHTTSISSYLIGAADPGEDYFPYPSGGGDNEPGFDKSFMLEPNWYEQFQDRMPSPNTETPPLPGAEVDGYSTLYQRVPSPASRTASTRANVISAQSPQLGQPNTMAASAVNVVQQSNPALQYTGSSSNDSDLRKRIDEIFHKLDTLEISRTESNHSEIILFVMTGIFVLLMLDLLLKQGCRAIGSIATASSIPQAAIHGGYAVANPFFF